MPNDKHRMIRECAGRILEKLAFGEQVTATRDYARSIWIAAFKLLTFERLISRRDGSFRITQWGQKHISRHGYVVYPPLDNAKNLR